MTAAAASELFADPPDAPVWVGWRRPAGGVWRPVAEGSTEEEAWARLYHRMAAVSSGTFDNAVPPRGQKP